MARTLCFHSLKGGTGKTTSAVAVSVAMARMKRRVLLIDADPQANATLVLFNGEIPEAPTLVNVLNHQADAGDTIRKTGVAGLDMLPADVHLAEANLFLADKPGRERRLRLAMREVEKSYDIVVIDTSPQRSLIQVNVLNYVREIWCPVEPGVFSLHGIVELQRTVGEVVHFMENAELTIAGLILTQARGDNLSRDVEAQLRATFGTLVCKTVIPQNTKLGESQAHFLPVSDYAPRSPGAKAYEALTKEILSHGKAKRAAAVNDGQIDGRNRANGRRRRAG